MNVFNQYKLCGQRGGSTFLEAVRPLNVTNGNLVCKNDYLPCDPKGNIEFTFCYHKDSTQANSCPITSIEFKNNDISQFTVGKKGTSMPILTFRITENTPCIDPQQSSSISKDSIYHHEYSKRLPNCANIDTNFRNLNVTISQYDLQKQNGVLDILEKNKFYTFSVFPGSSIKKQITLTAYTRPTIPWNLECEKTEFNR